MAPNDRPSFGKIVETLRAILKDSPLPENLEKTAAVNKIPGVRRSNSFMKNDGGSAVDEIACVNERAHRQNAPLDTTFFHE